MNLSEIVSFDIHRVRHIKFTFEPQILYIFRTLSNSGSPCNQTNFDETLPISVGLIKRLLKIVRVQKLEKFILTQKKFFLK